MDEFPRPRLVLDVETIPIGNAADFLSLEDVAAPGNYKDPAKIDAYKADKRREMIERAALDVDLARIVALGTSVDGEAVSVTRCETERDEKQALLEFCAFVEHESPTIITFNGNRYDLPLIMRRCAYLGLPIPDLSTDPYRGANVDVFARLTLNGKIPGHSLSWFARRLGWSDCQSAIDGSEVGAAVARGDWPAIEDHCRADVIATGRLARHFNFW